MFIVSDVGWGSERQSLCFSLLHELHESKGIYSAAHAAAEQRHLLCCVCYSGEKASTLLLVLQWSKGFYSTAAQTVE